MRLPIAGKIILLTLSALVCSCVAVLLVTLRLLEPPLDESVDATIHITKTMAARSYEALTEKFREEIAFIANDSRLIDVTISRDIPKAQALAAELQKSCGVEILTLTDDKASCLRADIPPRRATTSRTMSPTAPRCAARAWRAW